MIPKFFAYIDYDYTYFYLFTARIDVQVNICRVNLINLKKLSVML